MPIIRLEHRRRPARHYRHLSPPRSSRHWHFEIDPPSEADMAARCADVLGRNLPWLVAEKDGEVLGFCLCQLVQAPPGVPLLGGRFDLCGRRCRAWAWAASCWPSWPCKRKRWACAGARGDWRLCQRWLHRAAPRTGVHRCGRDALGGLEIWRLARHRAHGKTLGAGTRLHRNNAPHEEQNLAAWLAFVGFGPAPFLSAMA